jgi:hypothetical protein
VPAAPAAVRSSLPLSGCRAAGPYAREGWTESPAEYHTSLFGGRVAWARPRSSAGGVARVGGERWFEAGAKVLVDQRGGVLA